jgi:phosphate acetyltransferase
MGFIDGIKQKAKQNKKTIVLPEAGQDARIVEAAHKILQEGTANLILIGEKAKIDEMAKGFSISGAQVIDPSSYEKKDELANGLFELRKAKGMTLDEAKTTLNHPVYLGCMLVKMGMADGLVAGAMYSTADVLRPALQIVKTTPGIKTASSCFVMEVPNCEFGNNGTLIFADCAVNQNPNAEELAAIAISSAESYKSLIGGEPVVGMLSHSTKGSAKHADIDKVLEATKIAKELAPDLKIDGELQADAAIVPKVGKSKAPDSTVAGNANVLVFPDLDAGNIGYKLVQRFAKAEAYGPVIQGVAKPINDLSRGCSVEDIVGTVAITAVQAQ